jgi:hypothetical protein
MSMEACLAWTCWLAGMSVKICWHTCSDLHLMDVKKNFMSVLLFFGDGEAVKWMRGAEFQLAFC